MLSIGTVDGQLVGLRWHHEELIGVGLEMKEKRRGRGVGVGGGADGL